METREEPITAVRLCPVCLEETRFELDPVRFARWRSGEYAQHVWPEWSAEERELLISGTHTPCWNSLFEEES